MIGDPTIETLRRFLEHAPKDPGKLAPALLGWTLTTNNGDGEKHYFVCAHCAGRIMARGCHLPGNPEPVWKSTGIKETCCVC